MIKPILRVEDLKYTYGNGSKALRGVSIEIFEGERIAVLGSNGSGKSTFFLNLNGVLHSEQGKIVYREIVINRKNIKELRKNIGIVFQDADNQIIAPTVMAEVGFGPMNLKLPREEVKDRVEEALAFMNLTEMKERAPHYLSGGEKKRVTIADIIAMKSEIVILDEPTAALDPLNAKMLETVLDKISAEGKTMLISTHDVDFAYKWAKRIVVFNKGEIIADGPVFEIFKQEQVLKAANLKKPMLMEVQELLEKKQLIKGNAYARSVEELEGLLG